MNSFGRIFTVEIFGESHGPMIGVGIDGVPAGLAFDKTELIHDLDRRKPRAKGTTPRKESDQPIIESGIFNDYTTGAPIFVRFENKNVRSKDYSTVKAIPRPGHADFVSNKKFGGFNDFRGGGHFSGRLTLALVTAGHFARLIIPNISIKARVESVGGRSDIEKAIDEVIGDHDSLGGLVSCTCTHVPIGIGEPFFDSIESKIAHLCYAIPAIKSVEFGSGKEASNMRGSEHNDMWEGPSGTTRSNHAGGINGGISNGNPIYFQVAVKPTSSIGKKQRTFNFDKNELQSYQIVGRHDACIALRVPVVLESVAAIALADLYLLSKNNTIK